PATRIGCSNHDTYYLSAEALTKANELFDRAAAAVKDDTTLSARVARERIALRHLGLLRYNFAAATPATLPRYRKTARDWITDAKAAGVRNFSEAQGFESYAPAIEMRGDQFVPPKIPPAGATLPAGQWDIQEDRFTLYRRGDRSELVDDAKASNGRAARL